MSVGKGNISDPDTIQTHDLLDRGWALLPLSDATYQAVNLPSSATYTHYILDIADPNSCRMRVTYI